jgi:hypothetical protein
MQKNAYIRMCNLIWQHKLDAIVLCIIFLVGYVYTDDIEKALDIGLRDESAYLGYGIRLPTSRFPSAQYAPLYALWYYLLSLFEPDAVKLYFLNYKLMTILPPAMLFITLRRFAVPAMIALVVSALFLFNYVNFPTWPKVSHFTVLILLFGFFLCSFSKNDLQLTATMMLTAFFASYIRPEFFLAATILAVILVYLTLREFKSRQTHKGTILTLAALLPCSMIVIYFGNPTTGGDRSMIAFGQHYAYNWVKWHGDTLYNPWTNWESILKSDFGNAQTPFEALLNNPLAVLRHIIQNLLSLPDEISALFKFRYSSGYAAKFAFTSGVVILALAGVMHINRQNITRARNHLFRNWRKLGFCAGLFLIILLPVVISLVVIGPQRHYIYIFGALLLFAITTLLFCDTEQSAGQSGYPPVALLCITLLLTVSPVSRLVKNQEQENLHTINFLRSLDLDKPVRILESDGGYSIYLGSHYKRIGPYNKETPFPEFLAKSSANMIVMSEALSQDINFRNNPEWLAFSKNPAQFGFTELHIPDTNNRSVFVSTDLLGTHRLKE